MQVLIRPSTRREKKLMAIFTRDGKRVHTTHFGARGYSDYTIHKDKARKERYIARHRAREDWTDPTKAGTLSRYVLWNKPSLDASIRDYRRRFGF